MGYTLENLCDNHYLVRLGDNHNKFGDPYSATVVMVFEDDGKVHFKGAVGKLVNVKPLFEILKGWGHKKIVWERYRSNGTIKYIEVEL